MVVGVGEAGVVGVIGMVGVIGGVGPDGVVGESAGGAPPGWAAFASARVRTGSLRQTPGEAETRTTDGSSR